MQTNSGLYWSKQRTAIALYCNSEEWNLVISGHTLNTLVGLEPTVKTQNSLVQEIRCKLGL